MARVGRVIRLGLAHALDREREVHEVEPAVLERRGDEVREIAGEEHRAAIAIAGLEGAAALDRDRGARELALEPGDDRGSAALRVHERARRLVVAGLVIAGDPAGGAAGGAGDEGPRARGADALLGDRLRELDRIEAPDLLGVGAVKDLVGALADAIADEALEALVDRRRGAVGLPLGEGAAAPGAPEEARGGGDAGLEPDGAREGGLQF